MKRILLSLAVFLVATGKLLAQGNMQPYIGNTYIFDGFVQVTECTNIGKPVPNARTVTAPQGAKFVVVAAPDDKNIVFRFTTFNISGSAAKQAQGHAAQLTYNFKDNPQPGAIGASKKSRDTIFFALPISTLTSTCSIYTPKSSFNFGSVTTPFKYRFNPGQFTSNLSLGAQVYYQRTFSKDYSWGIMAGVSLTSVTLDSFSTKGVVTTSTDRPALTPSIGAMLGYKNINILVSLGLDHINKTSTIEESWVYNNKVWLGFGIGISLFTASSNSTTTNTNQANK
jgi:hypothetical protein